MRPQLSFWGLNAFLFAICLVGLLAGILFGPLKLSLQDCLLAVFGQGPQPIISLIWDLRLPRGVAALLTGFSLGLCGAALQALLRNPLAEPGIMGVSAAAAVGAVTVIALTGLGGGLLASLGGFWLALAPAGGAILASLLVSMMLYAVAQRGISTTGLILVGVGISTLCAALMSLVMNLTKNPFTMAEMINWLMGSTQNRSWNDIFIALVPTVLGAILCLFSQRELSALTLGEATAQSMGVDLRKVRTLVLLGTSLAAGGVTAMTGTIGFVGLVAPHLIRPIVHHDPGRALLPAGLMAAALVVWTDLGVRLLPFAHELKLGVAVSLFGAPIFIWIALKTQQRAL